MAQGQTLGDGSSEFQIVEFYDGQVLLRDTNSLVEKLVPEGVLIDAIHHGHVKTTHQIHVDKMATELQEHGMSRHALSRLSPAAATTLEHKLRWLRTLKAHGITDIRDEVWVRQVVDRLAATTLSGITKFALSTLAAAQRTFERSRGYPQSLVPNFARRGGIGGTRLHPIIETIIEEVIASYVLAPEKIIVLKEADDSVRARVMQMQATQPELSLAIPAASTVSRRMKVEFSAYDLCQRRYGKKRAERLFRDNPFRIRADRPLEVVECDDVDLSVFLVSKKTGLPCGRAHLTQSIDQYSAVPLGTNLSHLPRDSNSAISCVIDGLLPKTVDKYGEFAAHWTPYGFPGVVLMDNAVYNHARHTVRAQLNMESIVAYAKPYTPTEKQTIEHFNHRVKSALIPRLPGWRGEKGDVEAIKRGQSSAVLLLEQFRETYFSWVTREYLKERGIDGKSPLERWGQHFSRHRPAVQWSREQCDLLRMHEFTTRFRASGGLKLDGLRYDNKVLNELRKQLGSNAPVTLLRDPENLTFVLVTNPYTNTNFKVMCLEDPAYTTGMTMRQQKLVMKMAYDLRRNDPSIVEIVRAREALANLTMQQSRSRKFRTRQQAERNESPECVLPDGAASPSSPRPQAQIITELEYTIAQLDLTEVSKADLWTL